MALMKKGFNLTLSVTVKLRYFYNDRTHSIKDQIENKNTQERTIQIYLLQLDSFSQFTLLPEGIGSFCNSGLH